MPSVAPHGGASAHSCPTIARHLRLTILSSPDSHESQRRLEGDPSFRHFYQSYAGVTPLERLARSMEP